MQLGKYDSKPVVTVDNAFNWPFEAEAANRFWAIQNWLGLAHLI